MSFSKTFPRTVPGSNYPVWEEVTLSDEEEKEIEKQCKKDNFQLLDESLQEAKALAIKNGMNTDSNITRIAIALFEKRASHIVFLKESKAKEKFDSLG